MPVNEEGVEDSLRTVKEDLHEYRVFDFESNDYFTLTEYPMIRRNKPLSLLTLQIRETDGTKRVYYEISGRHSLDHWERAETPGFQTCRLLLESMRDLFADLEECLLCLEQVDFRKEDIYVSADRRIQWIYLPGKDEKIRERMEELLIWLLSILDYGDRTALDLICGSLQSLKSEGLDREILDRILEEKNERIEGKADEERTYKEDRKRKAEADIEWVGEEKDTGKPEMKKGRKLQVKQAVILSLLIPDMAACGYLIYCVSLRGSTVFLTLCLLVVLLIFLVLCTIGFRLFPVSREPDRISPDNEDDFDRERKYDFDTEWKDEDSEEIFRRLEDFRDKGEETVLLSSRRMTPGAVLLRKDGTESIEISMIPFYVGSEEALNHLVLKNRAVSRQHAVIDRRERGAYYLEDLHSRNSTFAGRRRLVPEKPVILEDGQEISFADEPWIFHFSG